TPLALDGEPKRTSAPPSRGCRPAQPPHPSPESPFRHRRFRTTTMSHPPAVAPPDVLDTADAAWGGYDVPQRRLHEQGQHLRQLPETLTGQRLAECGSSHMEAIGRVRIRTADNCIARDIVQAGECLLFGYNVFLGLKKETSVAAVFSLYRLVEAAEG